jgi:hypothetical protein
MALSAYKIKILIIGDSLSLPRKKPEITTLDQTWPYLLKSNAQFEIIQISIGGGTLQNLYEQSFYYVETEPDIVIIQSGIVDCAPHALGRLEREIIGNFRVLNFLFHHFFPTNFMRKYRKITFTRKKDFMKLAKELINRFTKSKIIWIGIVPACSGYEKKVPGISNNIEIFNKIITAEIETGHGLFLSTDNIPSDGIMSDYHHLTTIGHKWLYERILPLI